MTAPNAGVLSSKNEGQKLNLVGGGSQNTVLASTQINQTKPGPNKNGQTRPASAPAKRPSSPN